MSDNDLIRRGDALALFKSYDLMAQGSWLAPIMRGKADAIAALPAVTVGVQEARDQAFRDAATVAGDAAVEVFLRSEPDAHFFKCQVKRQTVALPIMRLIGTSHPTVAGDDE
jgi:hypothetical protein